MSHKDVSTNYAALWNSTFPIFASFFAIPREQFSGRFFADRNRPGPSIAYARLHRVFNAKVYANFFFILFFAKFNIKALT